MRRSLCRNVTYNTFQILTNQVLGLAVFWWLSRYLDKSSFGELNWSLAVLTFVTTLLSLRLEQIVVRNVAAGDDPSGMLTLFAGHNFFTGLVFFGVLSIVCYGCPSFGKQHYLLWILSISQLLTFWALPFRQLLTGRGAFGWLALLTSVSNLIRTAGLYVCMIFSTPDLRVVLLLFIVSSLAELVLGAWIVCGRLGIPMGMTDALAAYGKLLRTSLPQVGMVFLQAGIARLDWILMGLLSTSAHTAEYTFAYRAFELAPLPLLVLAPMLLNRLAREEGRWGIDGEEERSGINGEEGREAVGREGGRTDAVFLDRLVRLELLLATLPTLWLVISWAPMVDLLTGDKYGASNRWTFLILSCCIPFQYINNIYWSQEFARNRLSLILSVTAVTGAIVLVGDVILIPYFSGAGAAAAFLAAMVVQYILYTRASGIAKKWEWGRRLLLSMAIAGCSGLAALSITHLPILQLFLGTLLYWLLGRVTGSLQTKETVSLWRAGMR